MHWLIKAATQKAISYFPHSEKINYLFRRNIARSLPVNEDTFFRMIDIGLRHYNKFLKYGLLNELSNVKIYEFGAGWDLIIPLLFFTLGIKNQTLVDIRPNIQFELINDTLAKYLSFKIKLEQKIERLIEEKAYAAHINSIDDIKQRFGITYLAPYDARNTKLNSESLDFIFSTSTLEHIPEQDILKILKECYRILKPNGILSSLIDLKDHYSYFDKNITYYNYLKYSDHKWSLFNSPISFQNRARYPDYIKMIRESGFEIVEQQVERPDKMDIKSMLHIALADKYKRKYDIKDLGVKTLWIVLKKKAKNNIMSVEKSNT